VRSAIAARSIESVVRRVCRFLHTNLWTSIYNCVPPGCGLLSFYHFRGEDSRLAPLRRMWIITVSVAESATAKLRNYRSIYG
jgi:hypothetical protein